MITDINRLKKDLIIIEDLSRFIVKIPNLHPDNPQYTRIWKNYFKYCIEGLWQFDNGGWRFMPPTLFFYANFFKLQHTEKGSKVRRYIKPLVRDLDWLIHYSYLEAQGFSGFSNDDELSCDVALTDADLFSEIEQSDKEEYVRRYLNIHRSDGKRKTYISPREYIKRLHKKELGKPLYENPARNFMLFGCMAENTKIRMFDGSVKNIQDIKIGDFLMGPDSNKRKVLSTFTGDGPLYQVNTQYGDPFTVTDTHILRANRKFYTRRNGRAQIIENEINLSVGEIRNLEDTQPGFGKGYKYEAVQATIEYPEQGVTWDSYLLGLWLGDGFKREKMICGSYDDLEILDWLKNHCKTNNWTWRITDYVGELGSKKLWRFSWSDPNMVNKENWFSKTLQNNKHIPNNYLINSKEVRLNLLAGMIDSDGSYDKKAKRFTITNVNLNLLLQFQSVARSLGFRAKLSKPRISGIVNSIRYDLHITGEISKIPTKLLRKKAEDSPFGKGSNINKMSFEFKGFDKFYAIEIDQDNLFVLDDYTVTHNARGGGKSFSIAGISAHHLTFDGAKEYTREALEKPTIAAIAIGAGITDKSSELVSKIIDSLNRLGLDYDLGVYGNPEDEIYEPNPFYRNWIGDSKPGNKKNPFRYEYEVETPKGWVKKGTNTSMFHINYSDKKQDGTQAGAGGRYLLSVYEEIGLMPNFRDALLSNIGTVSVDGEQFGVQCAIGTSGNIDLVQQTKLVFENPEEYNFLGFENIWETSDNLIGLFLPAYITENRFKDKNGNTDIEMALKHYAERRMDAASKSDPASIYNEKMNFPLVPSDMWISNKGSYFPQIELMEREKELVRDFHYKTLGQPTKLIWDSKALNGVRAEYDPDIELIQTFPFNRTVTKIDGGVCIYEKPQLIRGEVPNDMYIATFDPYVSENIDEGGSLGVTKIFLNPKYISEGFNGNYLVATYIGKHPNGKDAYFEIQEKMLAYYGNPLRGLWYEANRGDSVRGYYTRKNKLFLLALRPNREKGSNVYQNRVLEYGFTVGNLIDKTEMCDDTAEWLLSQTMFNGKKMRVVETYPCLFTIQQLIQFDLKGNFDAVSALLGFPLALKEQEHALVKEKNKPKLNPLASLSMNPNLFRTSDIMNRIKKYEIEQQQ